MASQGKNKPARGGESEMKRRFRQNPLVFVGTFFVLIIVVIAFVFVTPAGMIIGGLDSGLTFGYYDRAPISFASGNYFAMRYHHHHSWTTWMRGGGELSPDDDREVWRMAFRDAAIHTAMLRRAQRAGYEPPARVVDRGMAGLFLDEQGNFSREMYMRLDENARLSQWRRVREDIIATRFLADVHGLLTPSAEGLFMGRMASTERSFETAVFSVDAFPDFELEAYAAENPGLFRSAHLSMITMRGSEAEARRVWAAVSDGAMDFEDAAATYSEDVFRFRGGDVGPRMAHELRGNVPNPDVLEMALSLAAGEVSEVVRTPEGWVFFRAESDAEEADLSDALVLGRVRDYMNSFARGRMENWAIDRAVEFAATANEFGLEEAFARHDGARRGGFGPIPINFGGGGFLGSPGALTGDLAGAANNELFWTVAFSTPIGEASRHVVQGGNVLVLFPTAETEADYAEVESVAARYAPWLADNAEALLGRQVMGSPRLNDRFDETYRRFFLTTH